MLKGKKKKQSKETKQASDSDTGTEIIKQGILNSSDKYDKGSNGKISNLRE